MNTYHSHSRDKLNRPKKPQTHKRQTISQLDREVEAYIMSNDEEYSLLKLASTLKSLSLPPQKAKQAVKEAIKENIKQYDDLADQYDLYTTNGLEEELQSFDVSDFMERSWQHRPIILSNNDYMLLQECEKYPIYIDRYDYSLPLHKFGNNINFHNESDFKRRKIINSNDVQFYTTKDENMLFAKVTNLKFEPINYHHIKEAGSGLEGEEKEKLRFNPRLYNRTFSISLYSLLEGDPKKSHPFVRYDSASMTHTNTFLEGDKRIEVFGIESDNPHFHFQNEDDLLLCIRKYRDGDRRIRWKTDKCNSIDCKHLVRYLLSLDNKSQEELEKLDRQNLNYGMPFLNIKVKGKKINTISVDKILENYPCQNENERQYLEELKCSFKMLYSVKSVGGGEKSFKKLISSLQFLQFVSDERSNTQDNGKLELLSNLEVECATGVVNSITNCSEKIIEKDYKPKYVIDNKLIKHNDEEEVERPKL